MTPHLGLLVFVCGCTRLGLDPGLAASAPAVAATAAELRWDRYAYCLGGLEAWAAATASPATLAALWDDSGFEWRWAEHARQAPLWGAPVHVAAATLAAASALTHTRCGRAAALASAVLFLGLCWNIQQSCGIAGWAWDWIEYAPLGFLGYAAAAAHGWARLGRAPILFAAYLALLQTSRAALLASTHHLQVPAATTAVSLVGVWAWAPLPPAPLYWAAAASFLLPPPTVVKNRRTGAGHGGGLGYSRLWLPHMALAAAGLGTLPPAYATLPSTSLPVWAALIPYLLARPRRSAMLALWRWPLYTFRWYRGSTPLLGQLSLLWASARPNRHTLGAFLRYSFQIVVPYFRPTSVFGFALMVGIYAQMYSGFLLALYYLPDPTFVIPIREDLCMEVWWFVYVYKAHVIGVDLLFVLSYLHILKKLYLKNYSEGDLDGWFTGAYAFCIYHVVVFLGITLSTNHLGDVTIMIAANIYWSLFFRWHKVYAPFFTNKHLSTDQLTRFMIAHYLSAWYYTYLVQSHVMFIHEMWDASSNRSTQQSTNTPKGSWVWDALKKEVMTMFALYKALAVGFFFMLHPDFRVVNYNFFEQWSETEMEEVNFFIVAPHWYFRPHMGLLTVCAHHYEGLAWLAGFYGLLCYTPHLYRVWNRRSRSTGPVAEPIAMRQSAVQELLYAGFFASILYVGGTLPCGRFYYENIDGFFGNAFLRLSYEYLYLYLGLLAHLVEQLERRYAAGAARRLQLTLR